MRLVRKIDTLYYHLIMNIQLSLLYFLKMLLIMLIFVIKNIFPFLLNTIEKSKDLIEKNRIILDFLLLLIFLPQITMKGWLFLKDQGLLLNSFKLKDLLLFSKLLVFCIYTRIIYHLIKEEI